MFLIYLQVALDIFGGILHVPFHSAKCLIKPKYM